MSTTEHPKDWREGRRLRAWALHQQAWKQQAIAEALGVTQGAVSQWLAWQSRWCGSITQSEAARRAAAALE